jgi:putative ABC transport system ATP-binding protein
MNLTERYIKEYELTALMVTHNMQFAIDFGNRLIMMDEGSIILDVAGEQKASLTVEELVRRFKDLRKKNFDNDEGLLAD